MVVMVLDFLRHFYKKVLTYSFLDCGDAGGVAWRGVVWRGVWDTAKQSFWLAALSPEPST